MSGTKEGAAKARDANLAKNPNYYKDIGSIGGKVKSPGGFGTDKIVKDGLTGKEWAKEMSKKAQEARRIKKSVE